jgi:hypothetical protein
MIFDYFNDLIVGLVNKQTGYRNNPPSITWVTTESILNGQIQGFFHPVPRSEFEWTRESQISIANHNI